MLDYFTHALRHQKTESFHILYLNSQNAILSEERLSSGTPTQVTLYPRQVIERALSCSATSMVIAHNPPSGSLKPSDDDINLTRQLYFSARLMELELRGHLIISTDGQFSFFNAGLMDRFEKEFD